MATPPKVSLYSTNDLKNATDDALAPYLCTLPKPYTFKQSHGLANTRLSLGYAAVVIAAATFYADWKLGWDETKGYTTIACVVYFILNTLLTYHIWRVEAGRIFVGLREGGQKLTLQSSVQKHNPIYKLKVLFEAPSGQKWEDKEIQGNFTEWFDEDGYLKHAELRKWLARNIDAVGRADPQSAAVVEETLVDDDLGSAAVVGQLGTASFEERSNVKGRRSKKKG